jgi:hypothetical protein
MKFSDVNQGGLQRPGKVSFPEEIILASGRVLEMVRVYCPS